MYDTLYSLNYIAIKRFNSCRSTFLNFKTLNFSMNICNCRFDFKFITVAYFSKFINIPVCFQSDRIVSSSKIRNLINLTVIKHITSVRKMSYIVKVDVSVDDCHKMFYVEISDCNFTFQIFHDIFNLINIFFTVIGKGSLLDKFKEEVELSSKQMVKFESPYLKIYWIGTLINFFGI